MRKALTKFFDQLGRELFEQLAAIFGVVCSPLLLLHDTLAHPPVGLDHFGVDCSVGTLARLRNDLLNFGEKVGISQLGELTATLLYGHSYNK